MLWASYVFFIVPLLLTVCFARLHAQTGFTKFASTLVTSEGAYKILIEHPPQAVVVHEKNDLIDCAQHGSVEKFEALLEKVPKDFLRTFEDEEDGSSLLHYACRAGNIPIITLILSTGFPIDRQSRQHKSTRLTPLMEASKAGKLKAVQLLLKHGATLPKLRCSLGKSAMDYATNEMKLQIRDFVLQLRHAQVEIKPLLPSLPPGISSIKSSTALPKPIMRSSAHPVAAPSDAQHRHHVHIDPPQPSTPTPQRQPSAPTPQPTAVPVASPKALPVSVGPQRHIPTERAALLAVLNPELAATFVEEPAPVPSYSNPAREGLLNFLNYPGQAPQKAARETPHAQPAAAMNQLRQVTPQAPSSQPPQHEHHHHQQPHHSHPSHHGEDRGGHHRGQQGHHGPRGGHHGGHHGLGPGFGPRGFSPQHPDGGPHHHLGHHHDHRHGGYSPQQHAATQPSVQSPPQHGQPPLGPIYYSPIQDQSQHYHFANGGHQLHLHMHPAMPKPDAPNAFQEEIPSMPPGLAPLQAPDRGHPLAPLPVNAPLREHFQRELQDTSGMHSSNGAANVSISFVGSEDMYGAHPDLRGLPANELAHELWNLSETHKEEIALLKNQLFEAQIKQSHHEMPSPECPICFEDIDECWAFECGHLRPCNACTKANKNWGSECLTCRKPGLARRIYIN